MSPPQASVRASGAPSASATMTQIASTAQPDRIRIPPSGTLRLRAEPLPPQERAQENERRVQWADDVVNNEGMGKKSSKVCCIYHKPRAAGESSDEDSSDSSSDEDSDASDDGAARPTRGRDESGHAHGHKHQKHDENCNGGGKAQAKGKSNKRSANAYERVPKNT